MIYKKAPAYYADFDTIHVNCLPPRSYFIPFSTKKGSIKTNIKDKRYDSDKVVCLNGIWDFCYYDNPNDLKDEFDTDKIPFDRMDVPSCWQFNGYGSPMYLNARYPFRFNPPKIPTTEPVTRYFSFETKFTKAPQGEYNHLGLYRTSFSIQDLNKRYIISFLGVASCIELYCNGKFVGYSEESHMTAEFDLSEFVMAGSNELVCIVHRWCTGTYLECQDMFRNNGIFRDVLLRIEDLIDIWDIDFKYKKDKSGNYTATIVVELMGGDSDIEVSLSGNGLSKSIIGNSRDKKLSVEFQDLKVIEWNAEKPTLYNLSISLNNSYVYTQVGFKNIKIDNAVYYLNGKRIKLRGVNHHDTSPLNGYTMTLDEIEQDLLLCKEYNVNCIRTSHYQPDPYLLELAQVLGIYIVDECDLETHGCRTQSPFFNFNYLSKRISWKSHYVDRMERHYNRDKLLKTAIVMWSLGNESGDGCNTMAMYDYIHRKSDIPVQYEGAIYGRTKAYDIGSQMYPSVSDVKLVGMKKHKIKKLNDRPYFLCEYAHAMGTGPGNLEGYWDIIYQYNNLMGGCIWEMVDHAVLHDDGSYTYGGDHGEWIHDSNFCCDGLFYPNRMPSNGAFIMKHAYRPLRLELAPDDQMIVFNTMSFTQGTEYRIDFSVGEESFSIIPDVKPLRKKFFPLKINSIKGDCFLNCKIYEIKTNRLVDETQFVLSEEIKKKPKKQVLPKEFSIVDGKPVFQCFGKTMKVSLPYTILFRANTDNDKEKFFYKTMPKWYDEEEKVTTTFIGQEKCVINYQISANKNIFSVEDIYEGTEQGIIITSEIKPVSVSGNLPRFGKTFVLPEEFDDIYYYGMVDETYIDMKAHSKIDYVHTKVTDMVENNIKPQESGNRCDTRFAEVSDGRVTFRFEAIDEAFELGIKPYADIALSKMLHRSDEVRTGTYVTISKFQMGIGTGSCGPETLPIHCYPANKTYRYRFLITWRENNQKD